MPTLNITTPIGQAFLNALKAIVDVPYVTQAAWDAADLVPIDLTKNDFSTVAGGASVANGTLAAVVPGWACDGTVDCRIAARVRIPKSWTTVKVTILWGINATTTGNVQLSALTGNGSASDTLTSASVVQGTIMTVGVGAVGQMLATDLGNFAVDTAKDFFFLTLRSHGADTAADTAGSRTIVGAVLTKV